ncbi:MAG: nicotinate-nucleotide pyrophosphorylase [Bacteroidetes bacterium OLB12]|nr:MAG: nicotinate-nucleotide pyrophosphorylase [Bacteroidetes bacterium OLB12]HNR74648.1 carboxylating nicotinate-nucleotide diphosphorylase [Cyclobacteriaceae bacterium]HNU41739.1 carboxylating nicotinate-nucleotide diphosphorylase [Cyclobacteriaceae bacterium]
MQPAYLTEQAIEQFIRLALAEDIGEGDHSTLGAIPVTKISKANLLVKDTGILAGVVLTKKIFEAVDHSLHVSVFKNDGDAIVKGDIALAVTGKAQSILMAERLVLNCMQRMSGIATYTNKLCNLIEGTSARLMDTRKTTPNFRLMEKWAVAIGGGMNHRFALYDMVMLKDNHIDMAGGVRAAIEQVKAYLKRINKPLKIEVETRTLAEVEEVLQVGGVDVIMLDNMSTGQMLQAVKLIGGRFKTEASGGITEATLRAVAECGVDYISVGALTHSVKSLDLSLKVSTL